MLQIAKQQGHDAVVLGGFGCGSFTLRVPNGGGFDETVEKDSINNQCKKLIYETIAESFNDVLQEPEFQRVFKSVTFPLTDADLATQFGRTLGVSVNPSASKPPIGARTAASTYQPSVGGKGKGQGQHLGANPSGATSLGRGRGSNPGHGKGRGEGQSPSKPPGKGRGKGK